MADRLISIDTDQPTGSQLPTAVITEITEVAQDIIAALLVAGTGITLNYNDAAGTLTITSTGGGGGLDAEQVRDTIGAALVGGTRVTVTVSDAGDTITLATTATTNSPDATLLDRANHTGSQAVSTVSGLQTVLDAKAASAHTHIAAAVTDLTETVHDVVGALMVAGTGVALLYDDSLGTLTVSATGTGGSLDQELIRDTTTAMLVAGNNIQLVSDDVNDTLTVGAPNLVDLDSLQHISGKRIDARVLPVTPSATPAINTDLCDVAQIANQTVNITNMSTNLTGSPGPGDLLLVSIDSPSASITINWGTEFEASSVAPPTATPAGTGAAPIAATVSELEGSISGTALVPVPAGVGLNDVIRVYFVITRDPGATPPAITVTPPAGFTEETDSGGTSQVTRASSTISNIDLRVYRKRQTSATGPGETTGNYTFTLSPANMRAAVAVRYTGVIATGNPTEVGSTDTASASTDTTAYPDVAAATAGPNRLGVFVCAGWIGQASTTPSGWTLASDITVGGGLQVAHKTLPASGALAVSDGTWAALPGAQVAWIGALLPDAASGGGQVDTWFSRNIANNKWRCMEVR